MREHAPLAIGSLFSGIGGLELGLERAGLGPVVWQVEKDEYCRAVLAKHWPDATRYEDVKDVGGRNLAPVDVVCGGFPCQDISLAGSGAGLSGARSGLWSEYRRVVDELRPRYVVVENVAALLGRGFGTVLGELAALGYDAWWDCVPASAIGALHQRDRLFVVAYATRIGQRRGTTSAGREARCTVEGYGRNESDAIVADATRHGREPRRQGDASQVTRGRQPDRSGLGAHVPDTDGSWELQPQGRVCDERGRTGDGSWWDVEPDVGRVAHGVPARVDRLRALGNAVVPQVAEVVGRVILELERQRERAA